jgi:tetratricopeptide (TPR) repeat protein
MAEAAGAGNVRALVARGRAHYAAGEFAEAVTCLTQVLRGKAAYADVYDMLGVIYHHEGRLAEAEEMFRTALRLNPAYTEAALNLVVTCNDLGKYGEAKTIYEQAMAAVQRAPRELDPFVKGKIANMHAELGATYRAVGVFDEAVREYGRALALCPTFADIRTELGKTLREMGELPTSIRELELVRAEQPRYAPGGVHLGLSYHAAGRHEDASAQWRAVLEADPSNASARMYLAMLDGNPAVAGSAPGATPAPGDPVKAPAGEPAQ